MPFTPYHWGPSSWIGLGLSKYLDFPTFLLANVIVDIEPFLVLTFRLNYPLHGYCHTFLIGSVIAVLVALIMFKSKHLTQRIMGLFRLRQDVEMSGFFIASILGVWFHVILDAPLYSDIQPLYPIKDNPFYGLIRSQTVYRFCAWSFLVGIVFYIIIVAIWSKTKQEQ